MCLGFGGGILLGSRFNIAKTWLYTAMSFFVLGLALSVSRKSVGNSIRSIRWRSVLFFCSFACLGLMRIQVAQQANQFQNLLGSKQSLDALIVEDVDIRTDKQLITVRPEGYSQNILLTTTKFGNYFYGDKVWLVGTLEQAKAFDDFDYKGYLERYNVYALARYPKIIVLRSHQGNRFLETLLRIKHLFMRQINKVLAEPYASLLLGILIGARKALPADIINNFSITGTSHIIAISGYNISIIISSLGFLAYWIGRRGSFVLTLIIITGFVLMSGASASVIRAAIMGGLVLLAANIGRLYSVTPALVFAAACMLLLNPKILYWDAGFQLSFLATAGIVYIVPVLESLTQAWPNPLKIKNICLTTFAAIAATLGLMLMQFGTLSLVAPVVNLLVLPVVPVSMFFGFFSAIPFVGAGFAFITRGLLWYILHTISWFASLHFASIQLKIGPLACIAIYGLLLLVFLALKHAQKRIASKVDPVELQRKVFSPFRH